MRKFPSKIGKRIVFHIKGIIDNKKIMQDLEESGELSINGECSMGIEEGVANLKNSEVICDRDIGLNIENN